MKTRMTIAAGLAAALLANLLGGRASAAAAPTGITVSPAFQMVTIAPGNSDQPIEFKITNNRPVAQDLSLAVRDFNTLNESGGLFFVGTNPTDLQKKYGLAKWLSLPQSQVTIGPKQTISINASVLNLPDLSAGGHYGALMISIGSGQANGKVGLQPIASSLLFVTKPEGATHNLSLSNVGFKQSLFTLPSSVTLRFQNTGNTHLIPRGTVRITAPGGKLVSKGIINEDSGIILPQTYRQYKVSLKDISNSNAIGKYKLSVDFRFDGIDQFRGYQQSIVYIPAASFFGAGLGTLTVLGIAYLGFRHFRGQK